MEEEEKELTYQPKTNSYKNHQMLANQEDQLTGDRNLDLYYKSKVHMKQNKTAEEYNFEKNAQELTFTPQINQKYKPTQPRKRLEQRVNEITYQKQIKLQELAMKDTNRFSVSNQIADGVNYKLPIGGKEGSQLANKNNRPSLNYKS